MRLIVLSLLIALSGCAATDYTGADDPNMAYFLVSKGGVSGVIKAVSGGVEYCKVTQKGLAQTDFNVTVQFDGETCLVDATSADLNESDQ